MSDIDYLPTDLEGRMNHVIEEAAEAIKAVMKWRRFGPESRDPTKPNPPTNQVKLIGELLNVVEASQRLLATLPLTELDREIFGERLARPEVLGKARLDLEELERLSREAYERSPAGSDAATVAFRTRIRDLEFRAEGVRNHLAKL